MMITQIYFGRKSLTATSVSTLEWTSICKIFKLWCWNNRNIQVLPVYTSTWHLKWRFFLKLFPQLMKSCELRRISGVFLAFNWSKFLSSLCAPLFSNSFNSVFVPSFSITSGIAAFAESNDLGSKSSMFSSACKPALTSRFGWKQFRSILIVRTLNTNALWSSFKQFSHIATPLLSANLSLNQNILYVLQILGYCFKTYVRFTISNNL